MTQRSYLWQCPQTRNTASVIAHKESHARRYIALIAPTTTWQFMGTDNRQEAPDTLMVATLNEDGERLTPWLG